MFKYFFKHSNTRNAGFSLTELIVCIGILAVFTAFLAPSLIQYIEKTRMAKDEVIISDMADEITEALSDTEIYNEVSKYICTNNVSCYVSSYFEDDFSGEKTTTSSGYTFSEKTREASETIFYAGGKMNGFTITFQPVDGEYIVEDAIINKFISSNSASVSSTKLLTTNSERGTVEGLDKNDYETEGTLKDAGYILGEITKTFGARIKLSSSAYKNSEFTIFISFPEATSEATMESGSTVYGQWNGMYLTKQ